MKLTISLLLLLTLTACGNPKSLSGQVYTDAETTALKTCNRRLREGFRSNLGSIDPAMSSVKTSDKTIDIAWQVESNAGTGIAVCTTDLNGTTVLGWLIDGVQVQE